MRGLKDKLVKPLTIMKQKNSDARPIVLVVDKGIRLAYEQLDERLVATWRFLAAAGPVRLVGTGDAIASSVVDFDLHLSADPNAASDELIEYLRSNRCETVLFTSGFEIAHRMAGAKSAPDVFVLSNSVDRLQTDLPASFRANLVVRNSEELRRASSRYRHAKVTILADVYEVSQGSGGVSKPACLLVPMDTLEPRALRFAQALDSHLRRSGEQIELKYVGASSSLEASSRGLLEDLDRALDQGAVVLAPFTDEAPRPLLARAVAHGARVLLSDTAQRALGIEGQGLELDEQLWSQKLDEQFKQSPEPEHVTNIPLDFTSFCTEFSSLLKLPSAGSASASDVIGSARFELGELSWVFNPYSRLLSVNGGIVARATTPEIEADFVARDNSELANAWVSITLAQPPSEFDFLISGDVILPAGMALADLQLSFNLLGAEGPVLDVPSDPKIERAGLIALRASGEDLAQLDFWTDDVAKAQLGKVWSAPVVPSENGRLGAATVDFKWPPDRPTLRVDPENGTGQRVGALQRFLDPELSTSDRLLSMRNIHAGETAWIIGNGPSVRVEDLDRLSGSLSFCFNRFHLAYENMEFRPSYVVSGDAQMIEDFGQQIVLESECPVFLASDHPPSPTGAYIWVRQTSVFPSLFSFEPARCVTPGGSSLYVAFQLAHWMGVRKFYLYGTDFRFVMKRSREAADAFRSATGDGNHFIKNYRSGKAWCPPSFRNIGSSFLAARELMASRGGFIRNASHGGALDIFEREDFESALKSTMRNPIQASHN